MTAGELTMKFGVIDFDALTMAEVEKRMKAVKTAMTCNECGKNFKKKIGAGTFEVKCPKCGGYDTEIK